MVTINFYQKCFFLFVRNFFFYKTLMKLYEKEVFLFKRESKKKLEKKLQGVKLFIDWYLNRRQKIRFEYKALVTPLEFYL